MNVRTFAVGATYYSHDLTSGFMAYHEYPTKEEATVAVLQKLDWLVDIHAPHLPNRDDFEEEMTWH